MFGKQKQNLLALLSQNPREQKHLGCSWEKVHLLRKPKRIAKRISRKHR